MHKREDMNYTFESNDIDKWVVREGPDQWKLDGNCSKCRKQKYCTKKCSAHKMLKARLTEVALLDMRRKNPASATLGKVMNGSRLM